MLPGINKWTTSLEFIWGQMAALKCILFLLVPTHARPTFSLSKCCGGRSPIPGEIPQTRGAVLPLIISLREDLETREGLSEDVFSRSN